MEWHTLRDGLTEWTDWDVAGFSLAVCLGLMPAQEGWGLTKPVFWSDNPIGNVLYQILDELVAIEVLERREEPDRQYRWNPRFKGSWEEPGETKTIGARKE